jgi:hypothetical protein
MLISLGTHASERSDAPPMRQPFRPATPPLQSLQQQQQSVQMQANNNSSTPSQHLQQGDAFLLRATSRALQQENNAYAGLGSSQTTGFLMPSDKAATKKKLDKKEKKGEEKGEKSATEAKEGKKKQSKNAYEVEIMYVAFFFLFICVMFCSVTLFLIGFVHCN